MTLPRTLDNQLLKWTAEGHSAATIMRKLSKEHAIECSDSTIRKRIQKLKHERAEAVGASVLIKLEGKVLKDLDCLDGIIERALEDELRSRQLAWNEIKDDEGDNKLPHIVAGTEMWSRLMHVVGKSRGDLMVAIERRLDLAGAGDDNKKPVTKEVRDRLIVKLDQLIKQATQIPASKPDLKIVS